MLLLTPSPAPLHSALSSYHVSFFNTASELLSKTLNASLAEIHDPKQTNKRRSHSDFAEETETFCFFKISFGICSSGSLSSAEARGEYGVLDSLWGRQLECCSTSRASALQAS